MFLRVLAGVSVISLAACSSGGGSQTVNTASSFASVNNQGNFAINPNAESAASTSISFGNTGYAYAVELNGSKATGRAGLASPQNVRNRPATGTGTYDASFRLAEIRNTGVSREVTETDGDIPVTVNFSNGSFRGTGDGLTIAGTVAPRSTTLSGTSTWAGTTGAFQGRANESTIIGAFQGNSPTAVYAGGLVGLGNVTP